MKINSIIKAIRKTTVAKGPELLTGFGIACIPISIVSAVRVTPRAVEKIKEDSRKNHDGDPNAYTKMEACKSAWKYYIPATVSGVTSVVCILGANKIHAKRTAALAAAYHISEASIKEYKDKVVEVIGEKKETAIRDKIAEEKMKERPVSKEVIISAKGDSLCYDAISGRYFKGDIETIRRAENELNRRLMLEMFISLNEFYSEINLPPIALGDDLGWNIQNGDMLDLEYSSQLADDGTPCLVINYRCVPRYDYHKLS